MRKRTLQVLITVKHVTQIVNQVNIWNNFKAYNTYCNRNLY